MVRSTRRGDPTRSNISRTTTHHRRSISPERVGKSGGGITRQEEEESEIGEDHPEQQLTSGRKRERRTSVTSHDKLEDPKIEESKVEDQSKHGESETRAKIIRTRRGHSIEDEEDGAPLELPISTRRRKSLKTSEKIREGYANNAQNTAEDADTESPAPIAVKHEPHEMEVRTTDTDTEIDKPLEKVEKVLTGTALLKKEQLASEFTNLKQNLLDEEIAMLDKEIASIHDGRHPWLQEQFNLLDSLLTSKIQLTSCRKLAEIQNILHKYDAMEHDMAFQRQNSLQELKDSLENALYQKKRRLLHQNKGLSANSKEGEEDSPQPLTPSQGSVTRHRVPPLQLKYRHQHFEYGVIQSLLPHQIADDIDILRAGTLHD